MQRLLQKLTPWRGLWGIFVFCLLCPFRYTTLKALLLLSIVALWAFALVRFRQAWVRALCAALAVGAGGLALAPGRPADPDALRRAYTAALPAYVNTPYLWGGGNHLGIDCSGLVQAGLIDAELQTGLRTGNPALVRAGLALWWHTRSARALGDGYRGETRRIATAPNLNTLDPARIQPGDLAVLEDGTHVLASLGAGRWIEADPGHGRTLILTTPVPGDIYFDTPVRLMRWRQLEAR